MAKREKASQENIAAFQEFTPKKIAAIDSAAVEYEEARDTRMEKTEEEVEYKDKLQKILHAHEDKLTYRDKEGNLGYPYTDASGVRKVALLVRSEEDVKVIKMPKPKTPKLAKDVE